MDAIREVDSVIASALVGRKEKLASDARSRGRQSLELWRRAACCRPPWNRQVGAKVALARLKRDDLEWEGRGGQVTKRPFWLIVARNVKTAEVKYYLSNAPKGTAVEKLLRMAFPRRNDPEVTLEQVCSACSRPSADRRCRGPRPDGAVSPAAAISWRPPHGVAG